MEEGSHPIHRKLIDHWIWTMEPFSKGQAWVDLILLANHSEQQILYCGDVIKIEKGQVARSELWLGKRWKWSRNKVRRFFDLLKKQQMAEQQTTQHGSIITLLNYNKLHNQAFEGDTTVGTPGDTTTGQRQDTCNIDNIDKNDKKKKRKRKAVAGDIDYPKDFLEFYSAYPRKQSKYEALRAFNKIKPSADMLKKMLLSLRKQAVSDSWTRDGGKYIPHPSTWLNQRRWEDEYEDSNIGTNSYPVDEYGNKIPGNIDKNGDYTDKAGNKWFMVNDSWVQEGGIING